MCNLRNGTICFAAIAAVICFGLYNMKEPIPPQAVFELGVFFTLTVYQPKRREPSLLRCLTHSWSKKKSCLWNERGRIERKFSSSADDRYSIRTSKNKFTSFKISPRIYAIYYLSSGENFRLFFLYVSTYCNLKRDQIST